MAKKSLTQLFVDQVKLPKVGRIEFWDTFVPGFGLRVSATGAKSWVTIYSIRGKQTRETLGTLTAIPSVADARRRALASMERARAGVNPVAERREARAKAAANTVAGAALRYLGDARTKTGKTWRPSTLRNYEQIFRHDILPRWGERPLADIGKADVIALLDEKAGRRERTRRGETGGAGVQATKILVRLRGFFAWCARKDLISRDPTVGIGKPRAEGQRDRVLSDGEIVALWAATGAMNVERENGVAWGALFRLLLLTAQREGEVAEARWSEFDLENRMWHLPGTRTKNAKPNDVALSDLAVEVIGTLPRSEGQQLLFSGNGRTPASGFSKAKARLDRLMAAGLGGVPTPWVTHDLRRTAATGLQRLGVRLEVTEAILNHVSGSRGGIVGIYQRHHWAEEKKTALEAWGRFVRSLVRPAESNVVELSRAVAAE